MARHGTTEQEATMMEQLNLDTRHLSTHGPKGEAKIRVGKKLILTCQESWQIGCGRKDPGAETSELGGEH